MKSLIICAVFLLLMFGTAQAQSGLDLKNNTVKNELLAEILNRGEMKELKAAAPTDSPYFLRLYSIPDFAEENCAPGVESEVACLTRYYLAIHDGSLGVAGTVYDLGTVGEITKIEQLKSTSRDAARLRLEISNYPKQAFKLNPKLVKKIKIVELSVNMDSLEIKQIN